MASAKSRRSARHLVWRRWFGLAVLVLVALLYYRPLNEYFAARSQRTTRQAELVKSQHVHAVLERKLREASTQTALTAEARLLGYVHPGEHLYIVKNIPQWRRRQNASRRGH